MAPDGVQVPAAARSVVPPLALEALLALEPAFDVLPFAEARARSCLPLREQAGQLVVAVAPPQRVVTMRWLDGRLNQPYRLVEAPPESIAEAFERLAASVKAIDVIGLSGNDVIAGRDGAEILSLDRIQEETSSTVRLTNSVIFDAYRLGASDIHFESTATGLRIKYRLDGVLVVASELPGTLAAEEAISRLKIMSELDIAERRVPQDGRLRVSIEGRDIDVRVSVMPSIHGEDAVLRILDKTALMDSLSTLSLDSLGFAPNEIRQLRRLAREPYGMVLVTGPTGSGKTTTLYAMLSEINDGRDKIITVEDPVEYQLPDVLQIPVNEKKGLTFARGLRSILRHDPDKIMVGEIRDPETAQIAVQSALTGHLVFTTVHANNALDVMDRFHHMGVPLHSFVACLNAVLAQRLVRLNCPRCSQAHVPDAELLADSGLSAAELDGFAFRKGAGCDWCRGTGYKGRRAVPELLRLDSDIREAIVDRMPQRQLRELTRQRGMCSLRDAALDLVRRGESTLEEINRVTFVE